MFITDSLNTRNLQCVVLQELRNHGIKYRLKKSNGKIIQNNAVIFGAAINAVPLQVVNCCGGQLHIPVIIYEACNMLKCHATFEGLFRKAGSQTRQKEIKRALDLGGRIDKTCHAVDIASILKLYLRALPEPIIGNDLQELFLRCLLLSTSDSIKLSAIQNALLLLPLPHLHLLHYIMEFFSFISSKSDLNKMDSNNLAIVLAPSVMPPPSSYPPQRMEQHVRLIRVLIENANLIGKIPESIAANIDDDCDKAEEQRVKKKRRSASLTRMLSGLRKMVSGNNPSKLATPDPLATPVMDKGMNKRRQDMQQGLSAKKRKEILNSLPHQALACTPARDINEKEHKKLRLSIGRKSISKSKEKLLNCDIPPETYNGIKAVKHSKISENRINFESKSDFSTELTNKDLLDTKDNDYVRIPKSEYEAIKSRVSAIESRISQEFNVITVYGKSQVEEPVRQVQTAYEKTLEEAAMLASPGSEQLAKRLSRELKIRQSEEHKIIRSPSARKIGTIRRRSRENVTKLTRTQTWTVSSKPNIMPINVNNKSNQFYPQASLKRGRPNTIHTGLLQPVSSVITSNGDVSASKRRGSILESNTNQEPTTPGNQSYLTRNHFKRASSFHGQSMLENTQPVEINDRVLHNNVADNISWKNASSFLSSVDNISNPLTGRASVAQLRSQNVGMVLAKARLFDGMTDSDSSAEKIINKPSRLAAGFARKPRKVLSPETLLKKTTNISYDTDSSLTSSDIKHLKKNYKSPGYVSKRPRSKLVRSPLMISKVKENLNLSSQLKEVIYDVCTPLSEKLTSQINPGNTTPLSRIKDSRKINDIFKTPRNTPPIKKALSVKSTKILKPSQNTVVDGRRPNTPLRANHATPRRQSPRLMSIKSRQLI